MSDSVDKPDKSDPLGDAMTVAIRQTRALAFLMVILTGGTGVAWFKADGIGTTLSDVARTAERNAIILGEMRDDISTLVNKQDNWSARFTGLSERVVVLEGQLRDLKERLSQERRDGK